MNLPSYPHYPTLSDARITLRAVAEVDISPLVAISFYDGLPAQNTAQARDMQARIDQDYLAGNSIHWVIEDRNTGDLVGTCGYYRGLSGGTGELGCVLLPQFQGKGYMTAALGLAIDFGKKEIQLNEIMAITSIGNLKAIALLVRLGFVQVEELAEAELRFVWQGSMR